MKSTNRRGRRLFLVPPLKERRELARLAASIYRDAAMPTLAGILGSIFTHGIVTVAQLERAAMLSRRNEA